MVYLIHFNSPLKHANHYIGFVKGNLNNRIIKHRNGTGAKILKAANDKGIDWKVVRTWKEGDRNLERKLKNQKKTRCLCPVCRCTIEYNNHKIVDNYFKAKGCKSTHLKILDSKDKVVMVIRYLVVNRGKAIEKAKRFIDKIKT